MLVLGFGYVEYRQPQYVALGVQKQYQRVYDHQIFPYQAHVRPYVKPEDYWTVYFDLYEQGKKALDQAGIEIPFPQQVIHRV